MPKTRSTSLLAYLDATGVLEHGTPEEIMAAKREYRKRYQRRYMREYRAGHAEVRFSLDNGTVRVLDAAVRRNRSDRGTFAKEATLAVLKGSIDPATKRMNQEAMQHVVLIHSEIRDLCRSRPTGFLERRILFDRLEKRIDALEEGLREKLEQ